MEKQIIIILFILSIVFFTTYLWNKIDNKFGLKRHQNILNSEAFKLLIKRGFKIERVENYRGIFGLYNNYLCDIYYDYTGPEKAFVINFYFTPQKELHKIHCANYDFLVSISKKHRTPFWKYRRYSYSWWEGALTMKNKIGYKNPTYEQIIESLDIGHKLLEEENLKPINKEELDYIRKNFPYQSTPPISIYHPEIK